MSWGHSDHVNLVHTTIGYIAAYYDTPESKPDILRIFNPTNVVEHGEMMKTLTLYNYNTCALCPIVAIEMSWMS